MQILAHRGLWNKPIEKNTLYALRSALDRGYGIETDLRDLNGVLVVSHNPAEVGAEKAEDLFQYCLKMDVKVPLALNIKADGLQEMLIKLTNRYPLHHAFFFDMSIPEMVVYHRLSMPYFTRQSDFETTCVLYESACGVWIDSFLSSSWITANILTNHLSNGKDVCLISDEIHGRNPNHLWELLRDSGLFRNDHIMLCTDQPETAAAYFHS